MNTNNIRNYNEITNNGIKSSTVYIEKKIPIRTEEDKDACLRFLTITNNILTLCHGHYTDKHINSIIDNSSYLIYFHEKNNSNTIVAFALVKSRHRNKGKILDILLTCAIPNKYKFGKMIAHAIYKFAVNHKYPFLYVSPRTAELRKTFIKYGFQSFIGTEGIDEVLEKEIDMHIPTFNKRGKTQKVKHQPLELNDTFDTFPTTLL
jgi:hypothetical protein